MRAHLTRVKADGVDRLPGRILMLSAGLICLLPLDFNVSSVSEASLLPLDAYFHTLSWRVYLLLKAAILWVPLGLLAAFSGRISQSHLGWFGVVSFFVLVLAGGAGGVLTQFRDWLEVLAAFPGMAVGYWMGRRAGISRALGSTSARRPPQPSAALSPSQQAAPGMARSAQSEQTPDQSGQRGRATRWGRLVVGGGLLALATALVADFPRVSLGLGSGLLVYGLVLMRWPHLALVGVPAALPLLDFAPWTGRFFLDEFDCLLLVTGGALLLRSGLGWGFGESSPRSHVHAGLPGAFLLALFASLALGLGWPVQSLDANATASYWSTYNGLRIFKGFLWGGAVYLYIHTLGVSARQLNGLLWLGMGIGLAGVGLVGLWEHALFVDDARQSTYRIFATFSSMHTGGGHIEAYLVAALPFIWLGLTRLRYAALAAPLILLTAYVMLYTVARGGVLALAVVLGILALGSVRLAREGRLRRQLVMPVSLLGMVAMVVAFGVGQGYFQQRFASVEKDLGIRADHWQQALAMRDSGLITQLLGMGLGSFPRVYLAQGAVENQPASFGFSSEQENTHFSMGVGQTVYYAQRIPFQAGHKYRLEVDVRSRQGEGRLDVPICEKQMLNSRACVWQSIDVPADGDWHRHARDILSPEVGRGNPLNRPPVELFLYNAGQSGVMDVDNLRLLDESGHDLLCNGDFSRGGDCWFFKTHSHLPWHIKNVWVHLVFEQGWIGAVLFMVLVLVAVVRLLKAGWQGNRLAWAVLASLAGLLTVGLFDSLLDAPRLAMLLMAWVLLGTAYPWYASHPAGASLRLSMRDSPAASRAKAET